MYIIQLDVSKSQNPELPLDTPATNTWEFLFNMRVQHSMPKNSETSNVTGLCAGGPGQNKLRHNTYFPATCCGIEIMSYPSESAGLLGLILMSERSGYTSLQMLMFRVWQAPRDCQCCLSSLAPRVGLPGLGPRVGLPAIGLCRGDESAGNIPASIV